MEATAGDLSSFLIDGDQRQIRGEMIRDWLAAFPCCRAGINPKAFFVAESTRRIAIDKMAMAEARTKVTE